MFLWNRIKQWFKCRQWRQSLKLQQHEAVFNSLYKDVCGFALSKQARADKDAMEYVYGEIEFSPFIALLSQVSLDEQDVFYDLGSGSGKAVVACAMVYPLKKYVGIELFSELHTCACAQKNKLLEMQEYLKTASKIEFICSDFLETPLDDAKVVFINSSAFFGETWGKLTNRLAMLPQLKAVITTSKPLKSGLFYISKTTKVQMSWGPVMAYIQHPLSLC